MGLRERLTRLEQQVGLPKQRAARLVELRAAAMVAMEQLHTLASSSPEEISPSPHREINSRAPLPPDRTPSPSPPLPPGEPAWPHPWPKLWRQAAYLREGTVFPPGTRLVMENARGETQPIDAAHVQEYRKRGWRVVGVSESHWKNALGQWLLPTPDKTAE